MKKELYIHFGFTISYLLVLSILNGWFKLSFYGLWIGGLIGTLLPDADHFVYAYFLRPQELTSQRARHLVFKKEYLNSIRLLFDTRKERTNLIFHSVLFQLIFIVVTFLIITSSGSVFGIGLVLSFYIHMLVDQLIDYMDMGNIDNWFSSLDYFIKIQINDKFKRTYFGFVGVMLLVFTFLV